MSEIVRKKVELIVGYYGSNCPQLGAYSYRGYDVIVSQEVSMPVDGEVFHVGIYKEMEDCESIEQNEYEGYSLELAVEKVDEMIDWIEGKV